MSDLTDAQKRDLSDFMLDNYGSCALGNRCFHIGRLAKPWVGRACQHWQPLGATTWDELRDALDRPEIDRDRALAIRAAQRRAREDEARR